MFTETLTEITYSTYQSQKAKQGDYCLHKGYRPDNQPNYSAQLKVSLQEQILILSSCHQSFGHLHIPIIILVTNNKSCNYTSMRFY